MSTIKETILVRMGSFDAVPLTPEPDVVWVWMYPDVIDGKKYIECGMTVAKTRKMIRLSGFSNGDPEVEVALPNTCRIQWGPGGTIGMLEYINDQSFGMHIP